MAAATAAGMKTGIETAFEAYLSQLGATGAVWEKKPAEAGEGEDAWCARQVAEHIAGANSFFGAGIAGIIGVEGPTPAPIQLANPTEAIGRTRETFAGLLAVLDQVKDEQLGMEVEHPRLGKQTVGSLMGIVDYHLKDHAQQLKTLCGS